MCWFFLFNTMSQEFKTIQSIGRKGLLSELSEYIGKKQDNTLLGIGDDAAIIKEEDGSIGVPGTCTTKATIPIKSKGAVSPKACAKPIIVPDNVPGIAKGTTWCITD